MANLFEIFESSKVNSDAKSKNEECTEMTLGNSKTVYMCDATEQQIKADAAVQFQNKDGAKSCATLGIQNESRCKTVKEDITPSFTIPKLNRTHVGLFRKLSMESREYQQEILPVVTKSYRHSVSHRKFSFVSVQCVNNPQLVQAYLEKKKEMKQSGYTERELADSFAFLLVESDEEVRRICQEGMKIGNLSSSTIGQSSMGVQLCRHADVLRPTPLPIYMRGHLIVFKIMKGRVKTVSDNYNCSLEPTPNHDCHMYKGGAADTSTQIQLAHLFDITQIYLYEYGDLSVEESPHHVCPQAVVMFTYRDDLKHSKSLDAGIPNPRPTAPGWSAHSRSYPAKENDEEFVVWSGELCIQSLCTCHVEMFSLADRIKPSRLGSVLNISRKCSLVAARNKYFSRLSTLHKNAEVFSDGNFINVTELRPTLAGRQPFQKVMTYLGKNNSMAVLKPSEDTVLLMMPDCSLSYSLGLTKPHQYPVVLHCIFVSKQSCRFTMPSNNLFKCQLQSTVSSGGDGQHTSTTSSGSYLSPLQVAVRSDGTSPLSFSPQIENLQPSFPVSPSHFFHSPVMSKAGPVECVTPSRRYSFNSPNIASQTLQQTYETAAVCSLSSSPPIYPVWKYMGIPPSSPYPPPPPPPSLTPPLPPAPLSLPNSPLGYMVTSSPNVGPYGPVPPAVAPLCSSQFVSATVTSLCVPNSPAPLSPVSQVLGMSNQFLLGHAKTSLLFQRPQSHSSVGDGIQDLVPNPGYGSPHKIVSPLHRSLSTPDKSNLYGPPRLTRLSEVPVAVDEEFATPQSLRNYQLASSDLHNLFTAQFILQTEIIKLKDNSARMVDGCVEQDATITSTSMENLDAGLNLVLDKSLEVQTFAGKEHRDDVFETLVDMEIDKRVPNGSTEYSQHPNVSDIKKPKSNGVQYTSEEEKELSKKTYASSAADMRTLLEKSLSADGVKVMTKTRDECPPKQSQASTDLSVDDLTKSKAMLRTAQDMKQFLNSSLLKETKQTPSKKTVTLTTESKLTSPRKDKIKHGLKANEQKMHSETINTGFVTSTEAKMLKKIPKKNYIVLSPPIASVDDAKPLLSHFTLDDGITPQNIIISANHASSASDSLCEGALSEHQPHVLCNTLEQKPASDQSSESSTHTDTKRSSVLASNTKESRLCDIQVVSAESCSDSVTDLATRSNVFIADGGPPLVNSRSSSCVKSDEKNNDDLVTESKKILEKYYPSVLPIIAINSSFVDINSSAIDSVDSVRKAKSSPVNECANELSDSQPCLSGLPRIKIENTYCRQTNVPPADVTFEVRHILHGENVEQLGQLNKSVMESLHSVLHDCIVQKTKDRRIVERMAQSVRHTSPTHHESEQVVLQDDCMDHVETFCQNNHHIHNICKLMVSVYPDGDRKDDIQKIKAAHPNKQFEIDFSPSGNFCDKNGHSPVQSCLETQLHRPVDKDSREHEISVQPVHQENENLEPYSKGNSKPSHKDGRIVGVNSKTKTKGPNENEKSFRKSDKVFDDTNSQKDSDQIKSVSSDVLLKDVSSNKHLERYKCASGDILLKKCFVVVKDIMKENINPGSGCDGKKEVHLVVDAAGKSVLSEKKGQKVKSVCLALNCNNNADNQSLDSVDDCQKKTNKVYTFHSSLSSETSHTESKEKEKNTPGSSRIVTFGSDLMRNEDKNSKSKRNRTYSNTTVKLKNICSIADTVTKHYDKPLLKSPVKYTLSHSLKKVESVAKSETFTPPVSPRKTKRSKNKSGLSEEKNEKDPHRNEGQKTSEVLKLNSCSKFELSKPFKIPKIDVKKSRSSSDKSDLGSIFRKAISDVKSSLPSIRSHSCGMQAELSSLDMDRGRSEQQSLTRSAHRSSSPEPKSRQTHRGDGYSKTASMRQMEDRSRYDYQMSIRPQRSSSARHRRAIRRTRQFHPYRKPQSYATFNVNVSDLSVLMQNQTRNTFKMQRLRASQCNQISCGDFSRRRFAQYSFRRNPEDSGSEDDEEHYNFSESDIPDFDIRCKRAQEYDRIVEQDISAVSFCPPAEQSHGQLAAFKEKDCVPKKEVIIKDEKALGRSLLNQSYGSFGEKAAAGDGFDYHSAQNSSSVCKQDSRAPGTCNVGSSYFCREQGGLAKHYSHATYPSCRRTEDWFSDIVPFKSEPHSGVIPPRERNVERRRMESRFSDVHRAPLRDPTWRQGTDVGERIKTENRQSRSSWAANVFLNFEENILKGSPMNMAHNVSHGDLKTVGERPSNDPSLRKERLAMNEGVGMHVNNVVNGVDSKDGIKSVVVNESLKISKDPRLRKERLAMNEGVSMHVNNVVNNVDSKCGIKSVVVNESLKISKDPRLRKDKLALKEQRNISVNSLLKDENGRPNKMDVCHDQRSVAKKIDSQKTDDISSPYHSLTVKRKNISPNHQDISDSMGALSQLTKRQNSSSVTPVKFAVQDDVKAKSSYDISLSVSDTNQTLQERIDEIHLACQTKILRFGEISVGSSLTGGGSPSLKDGVDNSKVQLELTCSSNKSKTSDQPKNEEPKPVIRKCYRSTGLHPDRFNKWKHTLFPITFDPWRDIDYKAGSSVENYLLQSKEDNPQSDPRQNRILIPGFNNGKHPARGIRQPQMNQTDRSLDDSGGKLHSIAPVQPSIAEQICCQVRHRNSSEEEGKAVPEGNLEQAKLTTAVELGKPSSTIKKEKPLSEVQWEKLGYKVKQKKPKTEIQDQEKAKYGMECGESEFRMYQEKLIVEVKLEKPESAEQKNPKVKTEPLEQKCESEICFAKDDFSTNEKSGSKTEGGKLRSITEEGSSFKTDSNGEVEISKSLTKLDRSEKFKLVQSKPTCNVEPGISSSAGQSRRIRNELETLNKDGHRMEMPSVNDKSVLTVDNRLNVYKIKTLVHPLSFRFKNNGRQTNSTSNSAFSNYMHRLPDGRDGKKRVFEDTHRSWYDRKLQTSRNKGDTQSVELFNLNSNNNANYDNNANCIENRPYAVENSLLHCDEEWRLKKPAVSQNDSYSMDNVTKDFCRQMSSISSDSDANSPVKKGPLEIPGNQTKGSACQNNHPLQIQKDKYYKSKIADKVPNFPEALQLEMKSQSLTESSYYFQMQKAKTGWDQNLMQTFSSSAISIRAGFASVCPSASTMSDLISLQKFQTDIGFSSEHSSSSTTDLGKMKLSPALTSCEMPIFRQDTKNVYEGQDPLDRTGFEESEFLQAEQHWAGNDVGRKTYPEVVDSSSRGFYTLKDRIQDSSTFQNTHYESSTHRTAKPWYTAHEFTSTNYNMGNIPPSVRFSRGQRLQPIPQPLCSLAVSPNPVTVSPNLSAGSIIETMLASPTGHPWPVSGNSSHTRPVYTHSHLPSLQSAVPCTKGTVTRNKSDSKSDIDHYQPFETHFPGAVETNVGKISRSTGVVAYAQTYKKVRFALSDKTITDPRIENDQLGNHISYPKDDYRDELQNWQFDERKSHLDRIDSDIPAVERRYRSTTIRELAPGGGVISLDETVILYGQAVILENLLCSIYNTKVKVGDTWILTVHSYIIVLLAKMRDRSNPGSVERAECSKKLSLVSTFRTLGTVELVACCGCERTSQMDTSLGGCLARFRQGKHSRLPHTVILSDLPSDTTFPRVFDGEQRVMFMNVDHFIERYLIPIQQIC